MARISTYPIDSTPSVEDMVIGTEVDNLDVTKNYRIGDILALNSGVTSLNTLTGDLILKPLGGIVITEVGNDIFIDGTNAGGVISVDATTTGVSIGTPIVVDPTTGNALVKSMAYAGLANVGHVPAGGNDTTFLRGDGTWVVPSGGSGLWTATGNDIYNNNSNAVVIGKTSATTDTTAALEISGRVSQVGLGNSTFFGYLAGNSTSTSNKRCTAFGNLALYLNVSSLDNTAIGERALFSTTGSGNTGVGSTALGNNTSGSDNVAIGDDALRSSVTASTNTAVGAQSLHSVTSQGNVGVGYGALKGGTTGTSNTGLGAYSLKSAGTSSFNTAVGDSAMEYIASGNGRNIAVGVSAGSNYGTGTGIALTVCDDSIFIGGSTRALGTGGINEIVIGQGALGNGSNTITLGNANNEETHLTGVLVLDAYTFATLPASPVVGMRTFILNGDTPVYGVVVSTLGTTAAPIFYNGTNWIYA